MEAKCCVVSELQGLKVGQNGQSGATKNNGHFLCDTQSWTLTVAITTVPCFDETGMSPHEWNPLKKRVLWLTSKRLLPFNGTNLDPRLGKLGILWTALFWFGAPGSPQGKSFCFLMKDFAGHWLPGDVTQFCAVIFQRAAPGSPHLLYGIKNQLLLSNESQPDIWLVDRRVNGPSTNKSHSPSAFWRIASHEKLSTLHPQQKEAFARILCWICPTFVPKAIEEVQHGLMKSWWCFKGCGFLKLSCHGLVQDFYVLRSGIRSKLA